MCVNASLEPAVIVFLITGGEKFDFSNCCSRTLYCVLGFDVRINVICTYCMNVQQCVLRVQVY